MKTHILHKNSTEYPVKLHTVLGSKAPETLYCMGNLELLKHSAVGFCGSRNASEKGVAVAGDCTQQIVNEGIVAVSGYARGVDETVHSRALAEGGKTIVVIPEGINHFRIKQSLSDLWDWSRVLVISEFMPDDTWKTYRAMERNKTIIGLSDAMIVVEARQKGGTIEAGRQTIKLGIPLFALSFNGAPEYSLGNQELQSMGAEPLLKSSTTQRANMKSVLNAVAGKMARCSSQQMSLI